MLTAPDVTPDDIALSSALKDVSELVDRAGKALVDQYRQRLSAREVFKDALGALAKTLGDPAIGDGKYAPIYVIIDELDRCRPAYAISLLEEIKHLFDVPGVVFIIAMHGQQLAHSVNAVYGMEFDSKAYLRRFFSRTYELRRPSIAELVASYFGRIQPPQAGYSAPQVHLGHSVSTLNPDDMAGKLLAGWGATPREALAIMDGLRIFAREWNYTVAIELPLLLILLLELVRGEEPRAEKIANWLRPTTQDILFYVNPPPAQPQGDRSPPSAFLDAYRRGMQSTLLSFMNSGQRHGPDAYVGGRMREEFARLHSSSYQSGTQGPMSVWAEYPERLRRIGRLVQVEQEGEANR